MSNEHYFAPSPESELKLRTIHARIAGRVYEVQTANGIFSPEHIDTGTQVLLANVPAPPPGGNVLDLGCGWGPIALTLALESPRSTVWAVDVNSNDARPEALLIRDGVPVVISMGIKRQLDETPARLSRPFSLFAGADMAMLHGLISSNYALSRIPQPY